MVSKLGFSHESHQIKSEDWYTPEWVFDMLGLTFDLDPCQPIGGIPWVPCKKFYTLEDNGLSSEWIGTVWLNPPYGKKTKDWLSKMHQHRNGISLLFARTDCKWFHEYCAKAGAILFLNGRIKFVDGLGVTTSSGPGSGSMLVAWGDECAEVLKNLSHKGLFVDLRGKK